MSDQTEPKTPKHEIVSHENLNAAVLFPNLFSYCNEGRQTRYDNLLAALKPHLSCGVVKAWGTHKERRLTCFFTDDGVNCPMEYSGRKLTPQKPPAGSLIEKLFTVLNFDGFSS